MGRCEYFEAMSTQKNAMENHRIFLYYMLSVYFVALDTTTFFTSQVLEFAVDDIYLNAITTAPLFIIDWGSAIAPVLLNVQLLLFTAPGF